MVLVYNIPKPLLKEDLIFVSWISMKKHHKKLKKSSKMKILQFK